MKPQEFQRVRQAEGLAKALEHAVTRYDRKQEAKAAKNPRFYYNPYALAHYLVGCDRVMQHVDLRAIHRQALSLDERRTREDEALQHALEAEFNGPLLTYLQRVTKEV